MYLHTYCVHVYTCVRMCTYVWAYLVRLAVAPIGVFLNLEMTNKTHRSDVPEVQTKYNCIRRLYLWMNECAAVTIGYSSPFLNETNRTLVPIPIACVDCLFTSCKCRRWVHFYNSSGCRKSCAVHKTILPDWPPFKWPIRKRMQLHTS